MFDRAKCLEAFIELLSSEELKREARIKLYKKNGEEVAVNIEFLKSLEAEIDDEKVVRLPIKPRTS